MKIEKVIVDRIPNTCIPCCFTYCGGAEKHYKYYCRLTRKCATFNKKNKYCPLVEKARTENETDN